MSVTERVAYVRGLLEGMELDTDKKDGKLWTAVISVLEELAESVVDLEEQNAELSAELDDLYEEFSALDENLANDSDDIVKVDEPIYQVICPTCGEVILMDGEMLAKGSITCSVCGEELEFDLSEVDDSNDGEDSDGSLAD